MEYKVERDGTLLPFLLERMEGRSRSSVKSYLTHGQVAVNGRHTTRHDTPLTALRSQNTGQPEHCITRCSASCTKTNG